MKQLIVINTFYVVAAWTSIDGYAFQLQLEQLTSSQSALSTS